MGCFYMDPDLPKLAGLRGLLTRYQLVQLRPHNHTFIFNRSLPTVYLYYALISSLPVHSPCLMRN